MNLTTEQMETWLLNAGYVLYFETNDEGLTGFFVDESTRESCIEGGPMDTYEKVIERAYQKAVHHD